MTGSTRRTNREAGYTMLGVVVAISLVSVALVNQGLVAGYGALATRGARNALACRQAALAMINREPPSQQGGSLEQQLEGWSDLVYVDPESGAITPSTGKVPDRATVVLRQWRRGRNGEGRTVYEVSASAVNQLGNRLESWAAANVVLSRRLR